MLNIQSFQNIFNLMVVLVFKKYFGLNLPHYSTCYFFVPLFLNTIDKKLLLLGKLGLFEVLV